MLGRKGSRDEKMEEDWELEYWSAGGLNDWEKIVRGYEDIF